MTATTTRVALSLQGVVAGYGQEPALHGVDLVVPEGSIVAVVGANGAGKSTLLRTISGLLPTSAGDIRMGGVSLAGVPVEERIRRGIVHVPERRQVIGELTVEENLRLGALWRGDRAERETDIAEVCEFFPALAARRKALGSTLSGGERQMLAIGRAFVAHPAVMLLDEPSLGLAPKVVSDIMTMLAWLRAEYGLTILLVEQNVRTALSIADTGVVLNLGRVVATRPAAELEADEQLRHLYLGF
ncbi:ABC transporter ATP-binding protein [Protaetiibacter mangrovi]|uniref:ABC transporter ATP-binding protein n=1 Tax=Protaetiibacter mangrovi TaxID=2970926 RepID=A0ABT1ZFS0_9MICO|nr:ABC transporter ATP-binding protein [Protaetiibacter mangrovi]MCS0499551.1 ABC transporter ATP-binding protein [Protaetiibacter mangrovi]TPX04571.1 ABC transporter ATP-binding protein [Schumannella luteola]